MEKTVFVHKVTDLNYTRITLKKRKVFRVSTTALKKQQYKKNKDLTKQFQYTKAEAFNLTTYGMKIYDDRSRKF